MPKIRISKSIRDRFKITKNGKIMRHKVGQRHRASHKSNANIRRGKEPIQVTGPLEKKLKKLLGI